MARTRKQRRSLKFEAEAWEADDLRQRLLDLALDTSKEWPLRALAAEAANEIEHLRHVLKVA